MSSLLNFGFVETNLKYDKLWHNMFTTLFSSQTRYNSSSFNKLVQNGLVGKPVN